MLVNIFIIEQLDNSKKLENSGALTALLTAPYHVICLDASINPYQFCRDNFYLMYVKPYLTQIPDCKYDPEEWTLEIIQMNNVWTWCLREVDVI